MTLPIMISARVKLSDEQRATLRKAYSQVRASAAIPQGAAIGGARLQVETAGVNPDVQLPANLPPQLVMADLLSSRDSISLPLLLGLQQALNVTVVSEKEVTAATKSYVTHVFTEAANGL